MAALDLARDPPPVERPRRRRRPPPVYTVVVEPAEPDPKAARAVLDWLARRIG